MMISFGIINKSGLLLRKKVLGLALVLAALLPAWIQAEEPGGLPVKEIRDDGLTVITGEPPGKERTEIQYLTLIIKTGYAHDPAGKSGLTNLTNELLYSVFRHIGALDVDYHISSDFSVFNFITTRSSFKEFCNRLDQVLRQDALLLYDLCNEMIRYHLNLPKPPELKAEAGFYSLVYGAGHPYTSFFNPNYDKLDINEVNKWFRQIYKPNNLIIAVSSKLPEDFLRRPAGRDLKEPVILEPIPAFGGSAVPVFKFTPVHDNIATICLGFQAPKLGEEGMFATLLIKKYLDKRLWRVVRQDHGLSYDLSVYYSALNEPSAPSVEIVLHTLAPDTGAAISMIIAELKEVAAIGIPGEAVSKILERERKYREFNKEDRGAFIRIAGLYGLFDQKWLFDQEEYFSKLNEESKIVAPIMATGLSRLKISVAGPEETEEYLTKLTQELKTLAKK